MTAPRPGRHWRRLPARRGRAARDRLVLQWKRLPGWVVTRWAGHPAVRALGVEDAVQAGFLGLLRAAQLFDPSRGVKFSSYAVTWIKQAVTYAARQAPMIRVPVRGSCSFGADRERALAVGPLSDGESRGAPEPADPRPGPDVEAARREAVERLEGLMGLCLTDREREVLLRHAGGELLREIGDSLGLTRERARQIEAEAMAKLRQLARPG